MNKAQLDSEIFSGLKALSESAFPKICPSCGKKYETAEEFLRQTKNLQGSCSSLKSTQEDDGLFVIEAYRNCVCGSTLMDFFSNRRDISEKGLKRRARFGDLMEKLERRGIDRSISRQELMKVLRGQKSDLLSKIVNK